MGLDAIPLTARCAGLLAVFVVTAGGLAAARQVPLTEFLGSAGDQVGFALASAGDVDADGYQDLVVGAPRAVTSTGRADGLAWIASGRHLATGLGAPRIYTWEGTFAGGLSTARFGAAVASADIDRDGVPDVIVGSPRDSTSGIDAGSVRFFSGATGIELARFGGSSSFAYGSSVAIAGDVNGDGWTDVLVGAPIFDTTFGVAYGRAYLLSGEWIARSAVGQVPVTPPELLVSIGWYNHGDFGHAVAGLGDLDGNGTADYVVGGDHGGTANGGHLAVFLNGATTPFLELSGAAAADHFGAALAGCGDVDGDSIPDLCVGAWGVHPTGPASAARGRVEMISGAWMLAVGSGGTPTVPRTIWSRSGDADHDLYGTGVTTVGDLDLDGALDVAVSGTQSGYGVSSGAGYVDVLSGRDGTKLFRLRGNSLDAQFGRAIAGLGDVDADGRPDFAIGAPVDSIGGVGAGAVRIVRGFPLASTSSCPSATANSTGAIARLVARGSGSQSAPALFLELTQAPPGRPAVFFRGNTVMQIPFGNGVRCAGGQLLRISAAPTGTYGALVRPFDVGPIPVGTLLVFQAWFDDAFAGGAGFNASDAAIVVVAP